MCQRGGHGVGAGEYVLAVGRLPVSGRVHAALEGVLRQGRTDGSHVQRSDAGGDLGYRRDGWNRFQFMSRRAAEREHDPGSASPRIEVVSKLECGSPDERVGLYCELKAKAPPTRATEQELSIRQPPPILPYQVFHRGAPVSLSILRNFRPLAVRCDR
jgi:hypothetical protein